MRVARSIVLLFVALFSASGCADCHESSPSSAAKGAPLREQQPDAVRVRSRLAARRLDPNKVYPKDPEGYATCGRDANCLVANALSCTKAKATQSVEYSSFGLSERVESRYLVNGREGSECAVRRERGSINVKMDPRWAAMLKQQGKTDEEVEQVRQFAFDTLSDENPPQAFCLLPDELLLEAILDVADKRYDPQFWRQHCSDRDPTR